MMVALTVNYTIFVLCVKKSKPLLYDFIKIVTEGAVSEDDSSLMSSKI